MQEPGGDRGGAININVGATGVRSGTEKEFPWVENPHILPIDIGLPIDQRPNDTPIMVVEAEILPLMRILRRTDFPYHEVGANIYGYQRIDPKTERRYFHIVGVLPQHTRQPSTVYSKTLGAHGVTTEPGYEDFLKQYAPSFIPMYEKLKEIERNDRYGELGILGHVHSHPQYPAAASGVDAGYFTLPNYEGTVNFIVSFDPKETGNEVIACFYSDSSIRHPQKGYRNTHGFTVITTASDIKNVNPYYYDYNGADVMGEGGKVTSYATEREVFTEYGEPIQITKEKKRKGITITFLDGTVQNRATRSAISQRISHQSGDVEVWIIAADLEKKKKKPCTYTPLRITKADLRRKKK